MKRKENNRIVLSGRPAEGTRFDHSWPDGDCCLGSSSAISSLRQPPRALSTPAHPPTCPAPPAHTPDSASAQAVATRACYLLCRLIKALRSELQAHLAEVLRGLQPHLTRIITTPPPQSLNATKAAIGVYAAVIIGLQAWGPPQLSLPCHCVCLCESRRLLRIAGGCIPLYHVWAA